MPDIVRGGLIIAFAVALFFFFRWMMKPDPALKKRAEEVNNMYPTDEEQKPIYDGRKEKTREHHIPQFAEGDMRHRPCTIPTSRPSTPPPRPSVHIPSSGATRVEHRRDDDNFAGGVMMGMMMASENHSSPTQSVCSPAPSYDRDSRADDNRCDNDNSSSSSNDSSD